MLFYNPIIRYITLNLLKLTMASLIALKAENKTNTDIITSSTTLTILGLAATIFVCALIRNKDKLGHTAVVSMIGTLY